MNIRSVLTIVILYISTQATASELPFQVVVAGSDDGFPPFAIVEKKEVRGGIIKDIFQDLLKIKGLDFKPIIIPKKDFALNLMLVALMVYYLQRNGSKSLKATSLLHPP